MRIGLVSYLNARPLGRGFQESHEHQVELDLPSRLVERLLAGGLDAALISSVECLRHKELFWCPLVGVAADGAVKSILYFERRPSAPGSKLPRRVLADSGSRTSQALLCVLFRGALGAVPELAQRPAEQIPDALAEGEGGLLIGDAALDFSLRPDRNDFAVLDLGAWWKEQTGLPMVFAVWASLRPLPDEIFTASLERGLAELDDIVRASGRPDAEAYLKHTLHYRLTDTDRESLNVFSARLADAGLL